MRRMMCCGTQRSARYTMRCAAVRGCGALTVEGHIGWCLPVLSIPGGMVQFGEDAIKEGMPSGPPSGMEDLFSMFTGGMGGRRGAPRERHGENVVHRLKVGLEEMYIGSTRCAGRPVGSVGATILCAWFLTCRKLVYGADAVGNAGLLFPLFGMLRAECDALRL